MRLLKRITAVTAVLAAALACDADLIGQPGSLTISLVTPHQDDGALDFGLVGDGLGEVRAASSNYRVYSREMRPGIVRVVVFGDLTAGPLVTVQVADVRVASAVMGTVIEVARRDDTVRADLSGYEVLVSRSAAGL